MVDATVFYQAAVDNGIDLICGVPDSLLKNLCTALHENATKDQHVVVPNEGAGIALATGHYLATGRIGLVYMQNSGLGNAINPLVSLTSRDVYQKPSRDVYHRTRAICAARSDKCSTKCTV